MGTVRTRGVSKYRSSVECQTCCRAVLCGAVKSHVRGLGAQHMPPCTGQRSAAMVVQPCYYARTFIALMWYV